MIIQYARNPIQFGHKHDLVEYQGSTVLGAAIACVTQFPECRGPEDTPKNIFRFPTVAYLNGSPVLRENWEESQLCVNDLLEFQTMMAGGGGENKGTVISIVSIVIGVVLAFTPLAPLGYGLIASGIIGLATQALMPKPETPDLSKDLGSATPTYSQYARNERRPGRPVPVRYGRTRAAPDLACATWTSWKDVTEEGETKRRQFYNALMVIGQGSYDVHEVYLGNQVLTRLEHGEYTLFAPGNITTGLSIDREVSIDVQEIVLEPITERWQTMTLKWHCTYVNMTNGYDPEQVPQPHDLTSLPTWQASTAYTANQIFKSPLNPVIIFIVKTGFTSNATFAEGDLLGNCRKFDTKGGILFWVGAQTDLINGDTTPLGGYADNTVGELDESDYSEIFCQFGDKFDFIIWRWVQTSPIYGYKATFFLSCTSRPWLRTYINDTSRTSTPNNVITAGAGRFISGGIDSLPYGPITLNERQSEILTVWADVSMPQGIFSVNGDGDRVNRGYSYFVFHVHEDGTLFLSNWDSGTMKQDDPWGQSFSNVPFGGGGSSNGKISAIVVRLFPEIEDVSDGIDVQVWSGFRVVCERPESNASSDDSLTTTRMYVTFPLKGSIQQLVDLVRVECTRKLPIYNGASWSAPTATREIAWAMADIMKNTVYGVGKSDTGFDLEELYLLHQYWVGKGWKFDMSYDTRQTRWDALETAIAAGIGKTLLINGKPSWWVDRPITTRSILFDQKNIVKGSFSYQVQGVDEDDFDGVEVMFILQGSFSTETYSTKYDGTIPSNPEKITLLGVTERTQAQAIARAYANSLQYRREIISFETGLEGYLPKFGTLVPVQHNMPEWGVTSEAISRVSSTIWMVDRDLPWQVGKTHKVLLRNSEGTALGPYTVTRVTSPPDGVSISDVDKLIEFSPSEPMTPSVDRSQERTHVVFGVEGEAFVDIIVTSIEPSGSTRAKISGIIYNDAAYVGL